jgi:uncharacterized membrane protein YoaK (UPF0700 family)
VSVGANGTATDPHPGEPTGSDAALPERVVVRLLAVLAAAAGCLDAVCVTRLGGLFASVITGNLVLLGRSIATVDGRLAAGVATAVGSYALGVAAGTVPLRRCEAGWRRRTSIVATVEVVLLTGVAVGWLATGAHPGRGSAPLILALASVAMGVQSARSRSAPACAAPLRPCPCRKRHPPWWEPGYRLGILAPVTGAGAARSRVIAAA